VVRDLKFAVRSLRRQPSFACAAIGILILGIGATTAVFSVLRGVLIAPLPYHEPERLVLLRSQLPGGAPSPLLTSLEFAALRAQTDVFESVAAVVRSGGDLTAPDQMAPMSAAAASETFFETLGVAPVLGRFVRRGDGGRSINISYEVWQRYFAGDAGIVGRSIDVNNRPVTVVGVLPRAFKAYLGSDVVLSHQLDLVYYRSTGYDDDPFRGNIVVARLRRGVPIGAALAAIETVARRMVAEHPDRYRTGPVRLSLAPVEAEVVSAAKPALVAAAGAVALVLLIACANLTNLLLARAAARTREVAVRIAIGARRRDIIRHLLAEGLVVGGVGAAGGWMVAHWGVTTLLMLAPAALPRRESITVDGGVALFAIGLAFACASVVSLVPARMATRAAVSGRLTRNQARGARTQGTLVAAQLALSVVLLVGAGLMARAFVSLRSVPLGFDPIHTASMFISLGGERFNQSSYLEARATRRAFYEQLSDQVRALSGVQAAGTGFPVPLSGIVMPQRISLGPGTGERDVDGFAACAGYLEALDVPLIAGRYFTRADNGRFMVIVNEQLARELWPSESPLGRRLLAVMTVGEPKWAEVIGVVAHAQATSLRDAARPQIWMTHAVRSPAQLYLVVRADDPGAVIAPAVRTVQQLGAGRPVRDIRLMEAYVRDASADTRFALFVIGVLAVLAVILAAAGLYGVVAYAMAGRRREMAVRLALGANRHRLVALVLGENAMWTFAGVAAGLAGAAVLSRSLESLLYGVGRHDPLTFAAVAALLGVVTLVASAVPASRAARVDPMLALRSE
jgi:putative ABC transport system permease protein